MQTTLSKSTLGSCCSVYIWMLRHTSHHFHPISHTCTHDAVPGGQAPGEITATGKQLLAHTDAADLAWCMEVLTA